MPLMTSSRAKAATEDFSGFYTAQFGRIAAQLHAYLGDRWEAQDLTQEAFCRAFDRWDKISSYEQPESWVRRVAWNLATNRLRHLRVAVRHLAREREEHVAGPSPDRVVLTRALAKLPSNQRLAIVLHDVAGLSTSEIAEQRGVAEGTVRSWLSRGRARLAEQLTEAPKKWEELPAPDVDFSRVRRQRALRRGALAAALAILVALPIAILLRGKGSEPPFIGPTGPPVSPTPSPVQVSSCAAEPLPGVAGIPVLRLLDGEPTGRYLVGKNFIEHLYEQDQVVLWTDGVPTAFTPPERHVTGLAVNSHGVVAGSSHNAGSGEGSVWTYHNGRVEVIMRNELRQVGGINARGDILLESWGSSLPSIVRFAGPTTVLRDPNVPGSVGRPTALGEDGTVVGLAGDGQPVYWTPDQVAHRLKVPEWAVAVSAVAVSGEWALGSGHRRLDDGQTEMVVLRWNLRTGEFHLVADSHLASDITPHGWMILYDYGIHSKGILDMDGRRMELPPVAGQVGNDLVGPLVSVSDDGRVISGRAMIAGVPTPTVWRCS